MFKNISVLLSSASSLFHCFLVENTINPICDNIRTTFGFAGVVIKTIGGRYSNIYTRGHSAYGIILKSNDYSHCYGVVLTNFECNSISGYQGVGLTLDQNDAGSPGIYWCTISNGFINHTGTGMVLIGDGMDISNINIETVGNTGVFSSFLIRSLINNVHARNCPGNGFDIDPSSVLTNGGTTWNNCSAIGCGFDGFFIHNGTSLNYFESLTSGENTGYGLNTNGTTILGNHNFYSNASGSITGTPIIVNNDIQNGKTGNVSFTPYTLLAGGTSSTGALQQVNGTGNSGQVLTSNGSGTLPIWQNKIIVTALTTNYNIISGDTGKYFTNENASGTTIYNLPSATTNLMYSFIIRSANNLRISAATGNNISIAGSLNTVNSISASTTATTITLLAINQNDWIATSVVGTWS